MASLKDKEIELVRKDLKRKGISMPGLENDLLDHLLCKIEDFLASGMDFDKAYRQALFDLNGEEEIGEIQITTISLIHEGKSLMKNFFIYAGIILSLIGAFWVFTTGTNPALILTCLSLGILFVYHSCFFLRKHKNRTSNQLLFMGITLFPLLGLLVFLFKEFPDFRILGMAGWCLLLVLMAIPTYYFMIEKYLEAGSHLSSVLMLTLRFTGIISLLWVILASSLKIFSPHVQFLFFLDDFLVIAACSFILSIFFQWFPDIRYSFKKLL